MRLPDLTRIRRRRPSEAGLTREEALAARPVRNPVIQREETDDGRVVLVVPLEKRPWTRLVAALIRVDETKRVELDEIGGELWDWLDGEATVSELVDRLAARHKLNRREAEVSLTSFLQTLAKRRFIGLAVEVDPRRRQEIVATVGNEARPASDD